MTDVDKFWTAAVEQALDVPAVGPEREAWITRNLCEVALCLEVSDGPISLLDSVVRQVSLERAPRRLTRRLQGLRERRGPVPNWYPDGTLENPCDVPLTLSEQAIVSRLLDFAAALHPDSLSTQVHSAWGGWGEAAVNARAPWRSFEDRAHPPRYLEMDIPANLIWRAWMTVPGLGPTRIVNDEQLSTEYFDIWWGVHDGSHLDHLATFPMDRPAPIEFGAGLLTTEALAMSMELLAGAEALVSGRLASQACVRSGIIERLGRISGLFIDKNFARAVTDLQIKRETEFSAIPTLARAYVIGPLNLIDHDFTNRLIPISVSASLTRRWNTLANSHHAIAGLLGR